MQDIKLIWQSFVNRIIHLFNPHCITCEHCKGCDSKSEEIIYLRKMLDSYMNVPKILDSAKELPGEPQQVFKPRSVPWSLRKQALEEEDRIKAQILNKKREEDLEAEKKFGTIKEIEEEIQEMSDAR